MAALSSKRLEDILQFASAAESFGWDGGTDLNREQMAHQVGMSEWTLARTVQAIKENPDLGISVSTRRGPVPQTVVTFAGERTTEEVVHIVNEISTAKAEENFKRTVRDAATSFVAYKKSNRTLTEARNMKPYVRRLQSFLMSVREQAVEDGDPFRIRQMAERALAQVGVHYDTNHDEE